MIGAALQSPEREEAVEDVPLALRQPCPDCGGMMRIIEIFRSGQRPTARAPPDRAAA